MLFVSVYLTTKDINVVKGKHAYCVRNINESINDEKFNDYEAILDLCVEV